MRQSWQFTSTSAGPLILRRFLARPIGRLLLFLWRAAAGRPLASRTNRYMGGIAMRPRRSAEVHGKWDGKVGGFTLVRTPRRDRHHCSAHQYLAGRRAGVTARWKGAVGAVRVEFEANRQCAADVYRARTTVTSRRGVDEDPTGTTVYNWTSLLVSMMDRKGASSSALDMGTTGGSANSSFRRVFLCSALMGQGAQYDVTNVAVTNYLGHPRLLPIINSPGSAPATPYTDPYTLAPTRGYRLSRVKRSSEIMVVFDGSMTYFMGISQVAGYSGAPY